MLTFDERLFEARDHIISLSLARYKWAKIEGWDAQTFPICRLFEGQFVRVKTARLAIETFTQLSLVEQKSLVDSAFNRTMDQLEFVRRIQGHLNPPIYPEHLMWEGLPGPPFHRDCTCRLAGVYKNEVEGV